MSNFELITEWINHPLSSYRNLNLASYDGRLYLYNTCIAEYLGKYTRERWCPFVVNVTKYSNTTQRHINILLNILSQQSYPIVCLSNIEINTRTLKECVII